MSGDKNITFFQSSNSLVFRRNWSSPSAHLFSDYLRKCVRGWERGRSPGRGRGGTAGGVHVQCHLERNWCRLCPQGHETHKRCPLLSKDLRGERFEGDVTLYTKRIIPFFIFDIKLLFESCGLFIQWKTCRNFVKVDVHVIESLKKFGEVFFYVFKHVCGNILFAYLFFSRLLSFEHCNISCGEMKRHSLNIFGSKFKIYFHLSPFLRKVQIYSVD